MKKVVVLAALGLLALLGLVLLAIRSGSHSLELSHAEFVALIQSNRLGKVRVYYPPKPGHLEGFTVALHEVRGTFYQTNIVGPTGKLEELPFIAKVHLTPELVETLSVRTNFSSVSPHPLVQKVSQWVWLPN